MSGVQVPDGLLRNENNADQRVYPRAMETSRGFCYSSYELLLKRSVALKVLVVESASASRIMLARLLRRLIPLVEVTLCSSVPKAIASLASEDNFDLVFLDLDMPDEGAFSILQMRKEEEIPFPFITMASKNAEEQIESSVMMGARGGLLKPVTREKLTPLLGPFLQSSEPEFGRILIVDDDSFNSMLLKRILQKDGYECDLAGNGFEAIRKVHSNSYTAVVSDIRMPYMSGTEAGRIMKREYPFLPIIYVTAEPISPSATREIIDEGDVVIEQPIDRKELMESLRGQIESKKQQWVETLHPEAEEQERDDTPKRMNPALAKFAPVHFLRERKDANVLQRGLKELSSSTMLEVEIHRFHELVEFMGHENSFRFFNSYFEVVEQIIEEFGGEVIRFSNGCLQAIFPLFRDKFTNNALHAALSVQDQMNIYNKGRQRAGYAPIRVGCALSTGEIALGIYGSGKRYNLGAFGGTVAEVDSFQKICRNHGCEIVMSESTFCGLEAAELFPIRLLGQLELKGRVKEIGVYEAFYSPSLGKRHLDRDDLQKTLSTSLHLESEEEGGPSGEDSDDKIYI